jgi:hypothetical protein
MNIVLDVAVVVLPTLLSIMGFLCQVTLSKRSIRVRGDLGYYCSV